MPYKLAKNAIPDREIINSVNCFDFLKLQLYDIGISDKYVFYGD